MIIIYSLTIQKKMQDLSNAAFFLKLSATVIALSVLFFYLWLHLNVTIQHKDHPNPNINPGPGENQNNQFALVKFWPVLSEIPLKSPTRFDDKTDKVMHFKQYDSSPSSEIEVSSPIVRYIQRKLQICITTKTCGPKKRQYLLDSLAAASKKLVQNIIKDKEMCKDLSPGDNGKNSRDPNLLIQQNPSIKQIVVRKFHKGKFIGDGTGFFITVDSKVFGALFGILVVSTITSLFVFHQLYA